MTSPASTVAAFFTDDPVGSTKTLLRFVHFIGLAVGLGGATLLDLMLLRFFVPRDITADAARIVAFMARVIEVGLKLLWLSGFGFLLHYALFDPEKLTNPKVHAKLVIVTILTLNGWFIHAVILPVLRRQTGRPLFTGLGHGLRAMFVLSGAISAVSWYIPVVLGVFWQLNGTVPALTILSAYLALIALAALGIGLVTAVLGRRWLTGEQRGDGAPA